MSFKYNTKIPYFRRAVVQNFPFIEEDFDALTDYGLLSKVVEYLNIVIKNTNDTTDNMNKLIQLYEELKNYVDNYFDNLDVQEEINNKLDEMAESGELENIIADYIEKQIVDYLVLKTELQYHAKNSETLYEGQPHTALQGFTCINNNILFALRGGSSNYANIIEMNKNTGEIIRNRYIEVNHANSIAYDSTNNLLYIASCNKYENNTLVNDNQIFILDYTTLNKIGVINVNNIPEGHRIRSVYYDNTNNKLYGGDVYNLYEINITNQSIVNTITLSTTNLDTTDTNQTLKLYKDGYVGIFLKGLVFWDSNGNVNKILKIPQNMENIYLGELEDFYIYDNGDIIVGSSSILSDEREEHVNYFSIGNLKTNVTNTFILNHYTATRSINIYVNNTNSSNIENGTSSYPFKDIQSAINFANNITKECRINIDGTNYENVVINGIESIRLNFRTESVIDGIDIRQSNVRIENTNNLTIKGININMGKLVWSGASSYTNKIEPKENSTLTYNNKNIQIYNAELILHNISLDMKNKTGNPVITHRSKSIFTECNFSNYDNDYAIYLNNSSECYINQCTFNKELSSTEHNIAVTKGSTLFRNSINDDYNNYVLANGGNLLPSEVTGYDGNNLWYGDVCNIPSGYTHAIVKLKVSGHNSQFIYRIIDLSQSEIILDTSYTGQYGIRVGYMKCSLSNNKISITENKTGYINNNSVFSYATNTDVTPSEASDKQSFIAIMNVKFVRL